METQAFSLRSRLAHARDEDGYIGVMALCIITLLVATSVLLFSTTLAGVNASKKGKDLTEARQAVEDGRAAAVAKANTTTFDPRANYAATPVGRLNGVANTTANPNIANYTYDSNNRVLVNTGSVRKSTEGETVALRWRNVASQSVDPNTGVPVYGITPNGTSPACGSGLTCSWGVQPATGATGQGLNSGLWGAGISTASGLDSSGNPLPGSTVRGIFNEPSADGVSGKTNPRYEVSDYSGALNISSYGAVAPSATKFGDKATVAGNVASQQRSTLSAMFDQNLLRNKTSDSGIACAALNTSVLVTFASGYQRFCSPISTNFLLGANAPSSDVTTVVVRGNLTIGGDINATGAGQVHFYVTGNVYFKNTNPLDNTLSVENVFIYAPNGQCYQPTVAPFTALTFTGAMACKRITLYTPDASGGSNLNEFSYVNPLPDKSYANPTDFGPSWTPASQRIAYVENPGYADSYTNLK
jgi:hypothetical protein